MGFTQTLAKEGSRKNIIVNCIVRIYLFVCGLHCVGQKRVSNLHCVVQRHGKESEAPMIQDMLTPRVISLPNLHHCTFQAPVAGTRMLETVFPPDMVKMWAWLQTPFTVDLSSIFIVYIVNIVYLEWSSYTWAWLAWFGGVDASTYLIYIHCGVDV